MTEQRSDRSHLHRLNSGTRSRPGHTFLQVLGILLVALIITVSANLNPARSGSGSHRQLSLPACSFKARLDIPGPACGMTTSFAHVTAGRPIRAFRAQPLGFLLFWGLLASGLFALIDLFRTRSVLGWLAERIHRRHLYLITVLWILSWIYKLHVFSGSF